MQVACPHCSRVLDFIGDPPSFCAYCGKTLNAAPTSTADQLAQQATRPYSDGEKSAPTALPGSLGGYRIVRRLGGGGMGSVFEAEETSTGQRVAVKVIAPEFASKQVAVERFRQEGRLASLISHPRCVFVMAAEEEHGLPYIVMELMPGTNLQELVEKNGPLPIQDAIVKILDVIEGLQEAHRLGVVHRDVKPSNCFLLDDGRVKIGDFGLSKSLVSGADLTKTGTFLGTLLYASPEQIKGERVDFRTDVYSVAATLYYLLAGQAPFQSKDAAATLARTIADPPTPLRSLRPDVPPALVKVILRGLERQPDRRWRNLDEFRAALQRFVPRSLSMGAMGLRAGAFLIDGLVYLVLLWSLFLLFGETAMLGQSHGADLATSLGMLVYFTVLEGGWGLTLGKWLLRLRVSRAASSDVPGLAHAAFRSIVFYALLFLTLDLTNLAAAADDEVRGLHVLGLFSVPLGMALMMSSMRARNGYRGLHEWASGTRVVRLPWPRKTEKLIGRRPGAWLEKLSSADDVPAMLGPFSVRGALPGAADERVLLAEDAGLGRKVLIQARASVSPIDAARRTVNRPTRLRWLSGGAQGELCWDAFLAPEGCPLPDLCDRDHRLSWHAFRGILEQLAEELAAASADGTLPPSLTLEQVWVQPNGRVQLLDAPLLWRVADDQLRRTPCTDKQVLQLLRQAAQLALEGRVRPERMQESPLCAAVPEHAGAIMERLMGGPDRYRAVAELQADLAATHDRPAEVNLTLRGAHLVLLGAVLFFPLLLMVAGVIAFAGTQRYAELLTHEAGRAQPVPDSIMAMMIIWFAFLAISFFVVIWVVWACIFRGGLTLHMTGLVLVGRDGAPASRLRCAWRAFLVWLPLMILLLTSVIVKAVHPTAMAVPLTLACLAGAYLIGCIVLALCLPRRSLHDRLAGTWLVPK